MMQHWYHAMANMDTNQAHSFIQTYSLNKGLKKFREKGRKAVDKEMIQIHNRAVFHPIHIKDLTPQKIKRAMESLVFLAKKRD
eukprot:4648289-Ditylum_brightwellii.AAC.1